VRTRLRRTIGNVLLSVLLRDTSHAVGNLQVLGLSHTVVGAVEPQLSNTWVPLDIHSLLHARSDVFGHFPEDGDLALENFWLGNSPHVPGDVLDKALLGAVVEDLLPQGARGVEVFWADLREECDCLAGEVSV
jgi:hypothetical protein